jgi:hypothetical protein
MVFKEKEKGKKGFHPSNRGAPLSNRREIKEKKRII